MALIDLISHEAVRWFDEAYRSNPTFKYVVDEELVTPDDLERVRRTAESKRDFEERVIAAALD